MTNHARPHVVSILTKQSQQRTPEQMFAIAVRDEEEGNLRGAIEAYSEILNLHHGSQYSASAALNLGTICFHKREYEYAEHLYRFAIQIDPDYALAFFNLGNVLDELGRRDEAVTAYEGALKLAPGFADAHYNLALNLEALGESRRALHHWRTYAKIDSISAWADHARRRIHVLLDQERLKVVSRASRIAPSAPPGASLTSVSGTVRDCRDSDDPGEPYGNERNHCA